MMRGFPRLSGGAQGQKSLLILIELVGDKIYRRGIAAYTPILSQTESERQKQEPGHRNNL
jgi:hypothetical protein